MTEPSGLRLDLLSVGYGRRHAEPMQRTLIGSAGLSAVRANAGS